MLGHLVVRLIAIFTGLLAAALAASAFLAFGYVTGFSAVDGRHDEPVWTAILTFVFVPFALHAVIAPAALAILIAELVRWRSLAANLLLGGAVALYAAWWHVFSLQAEMPSRQALVALAATGFIGGFAYWLIAGRNSGRWLDAWRSTS